jgi:hypothetical protein
MSQCIPLYNYYDNKNRKKVNMKKKKKPLSTTCPAKNPLSERLFPASSVEAIPCPCGNFHLYLGGSVSFCCTQPKMLRDIPTQDSVHYAIFEFLPTVYSVTRPLKLTLPCTCHCHKLADLVLLLYPDRNHGK